MVGDVVKQVLSDNSSRYVEATGDEPKKKGKGNK